MNELGLSISALVIADDDYGRYLSVLLGRAGYQVTVVGDVRPAMELCRVRRFSFVLIAQQSESILLLESFCHWLRHDEWYRIRPVLVLCHGNSGGVETFFKFGADDVVYFPVSGSELLMRIQGALRRVSVLENAYADSYARLADSLLRRYDRKSIELEEQISHKVYCELIYSATEGHFILLGREEFDDYLKALDDGKSFKRESAVCIDNSLAVDTALDVTERAFREYGELHADEPFDEDAVNDMMLCISELACNIIKHGGGLGEVNINVNSEDVRLYSRDNGTGINEAFLANAVFMGGASGSKSFGFGFSILSEMSDYIIMTTGPSGTQIMLIKQRVPEDKPTMADEILARF